MNAIRLLVTALTLAVILSADDARAQSAPSLYNRALEREQALRAGVSTATLKQVRAVVAAYEAVVRKHPASSYCDNALWQGANLAILAHERFGDAADRATAVRLLGQLRSQYPSSSLVARAAMLAASLETPRPVVAAVEPLPEPVPAPGAAAAPVTIRSVRRSDLPDGVRVTIELDSEVAFHSERVENPSRVFFDLRNTKVGSTLQERPIKFDDTLVREIRFGRHPGATRVVMDMEGADRYSVFTLYDPFRVIVDFRRAATAAQPAQLVAPNPGPIAPPRKPAAPVDPPAAPAEAVPAVDRGVPALPSPSVPSANSTGKFSLSRQLGLGVSRIVIDAGHGGHDPGARANGLAEAELTLDVALRLQKLLQQQPGVEVIMTRGTDVFIPLEERTRIANRENADLFLSIHANASRNVQARGIETYFLNFALTPDAEAVAARENAGSNQPMHKLPDIVRAITLNNKINESRDFADMVQHSMVKRLASRTRPVRDIGVKQAPFVVLIGAAMPSVLAEISFVTNKQDAVLLKTGAHRQQIAEALLDGVLRYQQSLKKVRTASTSQAR